MSTENQSAFDYRKYWEDHYASGGNSGLGSYGVLALFKAEVINEYIKEQQVKSVIEFGCGDGNQLLFMKYANYLGLDISPTSVQMCARMFGKDSSKSFLLYHPKSFYNQGYLKSDLVVCLDVLYHIIDEEEFEKTLDDIFSCAKKHVILYTKVTDGTESQVVDMIKDRDILHYLKKYNDFSVTRRIEQKYPDLSSASFLILEKNPPTAT
ncbi:methyltransferase domain-containing protein [Brevibacillus porteri]|uniref:class I SAM-dependent methyltransferase n=1 Tax=Brevibacillus porteri TaxID=2126350 RepID=UPI003D25EE32